MNEVIDFDISQVSKALNDLIAKFKKIAETKENAFDDSEIIKLSKQVEDLTKELNDLEKQRNDSFDTDEIKKFNAEIEKTAKSINTAFDSNSTVKLSKSVNDLTKDLKELEKKRDASFDVEEIKRFNNEIKKTSEEIKKLKMPDLTDEKKGGGLDSFTNILKGGAIVGVATQIFNLGKAFLNLTDEVNKSRNQMQQFSGLSGSVLDETTAKARSLATSFNKDFNEVLKASNALSKSMGISFEESLNLIEKGFIKGADANGEFLDTVAEYGSQFKNAGYSAEEFIKITTQGTLGGIWSDKLVDSIKELGLSLAELPKVSQDALKNAFGSDFTNKLVRDLDKGTISTREGLKRIQNEAKRTGLSVSQMQTLVTDVFKGAGEDVGSLVDIFKQLDEAEKINLDNLSEAEKATQKSIQANKEYEAALLDLSKSFEGWGKGISTFFTNLTTKIITSITTWKKSFNTSAGLEEFTKNLKEGASNVDKLTVSQVQSEIKRLEQLQANYNITLQEIASGKTRLSDEQNAKLKASIEEKQGFILNNLTALYDKQLKMRQDFYAKDKEVISTGEKETNAELLAAQEKAQAERFKSAVKAKEDELALEEMALQIRKNMQFERMNISEKEVEDIIFKKTAAEQNAEIMTSIYQKSKEAADEAAAADEEKVNNTNEFFAKQYEQKVLAQQNMAALDIAILEGAANFTTSLTAIFGESVGQFGQLFQDVSAIFSAYQKLQDIQRGKDAIDAASNISVGVSKAAKLGFPQAIPAIFSLLATVATAFGTVKRIAKFNEGTRYVEGGGNTDTVPAMLTAGEAVITQSENKKLKPVFSALDNGMITHNQLVNFAKGKLKSGVVEKNVVQQAVTKIDEKALQNAFESAIKKLPINKFSFDENGFNRSVQSGLSEINFLNKVFK